jgi:hypothetical protein
MFRVFRSIVLFLTLIVFATPAYADSECNGQVVDSTGKANTDTIKSALSSLINDGADPRVRIITAAQINAAGGNLDKYAQGMVKRCSAWQSPGGNMKSNLLILAVTQDSVDSPVGIYFSKSGPLTALRGQTAGVRSEMASTLQSDVTTSIQNGIKAIHGSLSVGKMRASETRILSNGPTTIINQAPSKPMNLTFLWALLFLGVVGAGIWLYVKSQSAKAKCRAAQQTAQGRRAECNNLLIGFDASMAQLGALLSSFKSVINASEFQVIQTKLGGIQTRINTAKTQFVNLQGSSNDPDSVGRTAEEYDSMTSDFDRSLKSIQAIDSEVKSLESSIRKINSLKDGALPAIEALATEIETATKAVMSEKILKTDGPKSVLQQAITLMGRANTELATKQFQAVADTCLEATKLAQSAAMDVQELGLRKQRVDAEIQKLDLDNQSPKLTTADATGISLRTKYGDSATTRCATYRALIVQNIDVRRQAIAKAKSTSFAQNWDLADQQINAAMTAGDEINNALNAIQDLGARIEQELRPAPVPSYRQSGNGGHSHSHTTVNQTTVVVGGTRDPFYDPYGINTLDALGNIIERDELNREREDLYRERRDLDRDLDRHSNSRSDDMDGDSGPVTRSDDLDMDGDSGSADNSGSDFGSGDDD